MEKVGESFAALYTGRVVMTTARPGTPTPTPQRRDQRNSARALTTPPDLATKRRTVISLN